jgi:acyl-CoA synthetase (AMP-forming)/AMP-acid ligase II
MSELGILRVKSKSRDSLLMKVGGEGVETRVLEGVLMIKSENRMMGYLNAESPFDKEGWYNTHDEVEVEGEFIKVVGRDSDVINVGGLKLMPSEVELVALDFENVVLAKAQGKENPVTGQHVELIIQTLENSKFDLNEFKVYLRSRLQPHMVPRRIMIEDVAIGHRFKKL